MAPDKRLEIAFVRRGYSHSGGAEAYLKRLALGVLEAGHEVHLVTTNDWPQTEWPFGTIHRLHHQSAIAFANELKEMRPRIPCDVLMSLERVWDCHVYRAGDGVHRAWLNRRRRFEVPLQRFIRRLNHKHRDILQLEEALFTNGGAGRVIVNSHMVKSEILDLLPIYAAADIFILPTIYDPFSNACLEALACGLPVITTRANGFSEIIEDGVHGSIVDFANDLVGLRDAIQLWSEAARRATVRPTNIQCAAQFDISGNVARTLEILTQAATSAASTSGKI